MQIGEATLDESVGLDAARRAVVEPEQHRSGIDRCQARALGIEAEIGRGIADRIPGAVDGFVQQTQSERGILRQGQDRHAAPHRLAPRQQQFEAQPQRQRDSPRQADRLDRRRFQPVQHLPVGPAAERRDHIGRTAGEQRHRLAGRDPDAICRQTQRMLRPLVERDIRQHRHDQPVALAIGERTPHSRSPSASTAATSIG